MRFFPPVTVIFLGLWGGLILLGRTGLMHDPGMLWHTIVGERILDRQEFFDRDPFSFTHYGDWWVPNQWLCECLFALLHRVGGLDALLLFSVTTLAALYAWVAFRMIRGGFPPILAVFVLVLMFAASSSHFHVRPHIGSIVFLGVVQAFLCDAEAGRMPLRRLFWLVPLFVLWTNWHGGVLGGLATLALTLFGWAVLAVLCRPSPLGMRSLSLAAALFVLCTATVLVNPYGTDMPRAWYSILGSGELARFIEEHAPLNPLSPGGFVILCVGLLYLLMVVGARRGGLRVTWLTPLVGLAVTCLGIRHAPLFAVMAGIALADLIPQTSWAQELAKLRPDLFVFSTTKASFPWQAAVVPVAAVALVFAALAAVHRTLPGDPTQHNPLWAAPDPSIWPSELDAELKQYEHARPDGTPIFNEYTQGAYLIYRFPGYRVFLDDRSELYRPNRLWDYVQSEGLPANRGRTPKDDDAAAAYFEREKRILQERERGKTPQFRWFDLALTETGSGYDAYFNRAADEWELVRRTPAASFYRRKSASNSSHE